MFADHYTIQREADAALTDAADLVARLAPDSSVVVIGDDVLTYEFAFRSAHPNSRTTILARRHHQELRRLDAPDRTAPVYSLQPRWGHDPEIALREFGVGSAIPRYLTPAEAHRRGQRTTR
jgi:hypothetical protein